VEVPDRAEHLLDQASALGLGVVVVRLLIQSIEQLASEAQLLDQVYFRVALVHFLEADDVRVVYPDRGRRTTRHV
jgi:hypothetical protein